MGTASTRAIVVGAGIGGLVTAALLARQGLEVLVLERAAKVGGKMRQICTGGRQIDAGPTVLTMRGVFEEIFDELGTSLDKHVHLEAAELLARHAWSDGSRLDLFADLERTADAIARFAGPKEAHGYRRFCAYAQRIHQTVEGAFLRAERPTLRSTLSMAKSMGLSAVWAIDGHRTMWKALGEFFRDARLRQLFGRYATYCGSSPLLAPATLNVIAHVEREGVYLVEGGMYTIAEALAGLVEELGGTIRCDAHVDEILVDGFRASGVRLSGGERLEADVVVLNADAAALASGEFGHDAAKAISLPGERSLSAITWTMNVETSGFPLVRHNVFFSTDYVREFNELFDSRRVPSEPTVYVCAQDRGDEGTAMEGAERLLILINAPASGDTAPLSTEEVLECEKRTIALIGRSGLRLGHSMNSRVITTPSDFARLFPATGGALYGPVSHGWAASFSRTGSRTRVPGLYLTGGSAHPGAGVPMVALSGRLAASSALEDLDSTARSRTVGMRGGTSTRSATTVNTR